ncbi:MAG: glycosyltransferase family 25 protein [Treponema sp.]|nr:glycosyltransferase family 25 protein [Treponema sp.]
MDGFEETFQIYVISLDSKDRRENVKKQFSQIGLRFEFIDGVLAKNINLQDVYDEEANRTWYYCEKYNYRSGLTYGEIGCALAHRKVYEKMINGNIPFAFIFEDDLVFEAKAAEVINGLAKAKFVNAVVKIDIQCSFPKNLGKILEINSEYSVCATISPISLTLGYYVDLIAAKNLYKLTEKIFVVADDWHYFRCFVLVYALNKPAVRPNENFKSLIEEDRANVVPKKVRNKIKFKRFVKKFIPFGVLELYSKIRSKRLQKSNVGE